MTGRAFGSVPFLWREERILLRDILRRIRSIANDATESCPLVYNCRDWTQSRRIRKLLKMLVAPFCVWKYFRVKEIPGREGLAFVLIAKNEAPYIEEWLKFHHKQGASHFIIYDNESEDNLREVLDPYIASGLVTYSVMKGRCRQKDAYNKAIHDYGYKFKYMGFIDADEFVFVRNSTGGGDISNLYLFVDEFMTSHPEAGGLAVNWCIFGSNGHITKPEGGVLENYTRRSYDNFGNNRHIKTICDPLKVFNLHIHNAAYRRGFCCLDERGEVVRGPLSQEVHFEHIRINHYFGKSREEFIAKRNRGMADNLGIRAMSNFDVHDRNDIEDTEILSHIYPQTQIKSPLNE